MDNYYKKRQQREALTKKLKVGVPAALAVVVMLGGILHFADNAKVSSGAELADNPDTVKWNGTTYEHKNNVQSYLFIGDDGPEPQSAEAKEMGVPQQQGMSDTLILLVIDQNDKSYAMLPIDRNTITDIPNYDMDGKMYGVSEDIQISFAHSAAIRKEDACQNTVDVVSDLLGGQRIDGFYSMNMAGIGAVNSFVDGVTVTVEDDFTGRKEDMPLGEKIRLDDEQAVLFVRGRKEVADGTNENRIKRQTQYLEGLKTAFEDKYGKDPNVADDFMDAMDEYSYTDITGQDINKIANAFLSYESKGTLEIQGQYGTDDFGWVTFAPDTDSLNQAIINLFYKER